MTTCCPASNNATAKRKRRRQPGSKNKPKILVANYLPQVLKIHSGGDVAETITAFARACRFFGVCVLFEVRDSTDASKIDAMVSSHRSLSSLDFVPHLAAGPIHRRCSPAADFTHFLHSRFLSNPNLAAYTVHPSHLAVVHQNAPIIEDIFAVDWAADLDGEIVPSPGSAMRFLIAKPREGKQAAEIVKAIDEVRVSNLSWGVNFSQGRAKGYEVGSLLEFVAIEEMIGDFVDNVIVVEVVVPFSCL